LAAPVHNCGNGIRGPKRGYDGVKKVNGRKRHRLVDTLGLSLAGLVPAADVGEREGARWLLEGVRAARQAGRGWYARLRPVWGDAGYNAKERLGWVEASLGWTVEVVKKPWRWAWFPEGRRRVERPGFTVLKRRSRRRAHVCLVGRLPALE
jgi:putative transposase